MWTSHLGTLKNSSLLISPALKLQHVDGVATSEENNEKFISSRTLKHMFNDLYQTI